MNDHPAGKSQTHNPDSKKTLTSMLQRLLYTFILFGLSFQAQAQLLEVTGGNTPPFTPENLISNIFLGGGVDVLDIQFNGSAPAVGYFTGGTASIGIERGIIMTTGIAESNGAQFGGESVGGDFASVDNPSTANDADLALQTTAGLNDVAVYTITFIPVADTLRFRYCFGSEEYPEYACSPYNDVFGFFIQGPGYPTPTNIAIIPGTGLPVTINNLHPANPVYGCGPLNEQFYNNNNGSNNQPTYDGYTDIFTAEAIVTPCEVYTIKLAIADVSDGIFDSGVFLEAKSFGTGSVRIEVATPSLDGAIAEGCSPGTLTFSLPNVAEDEFVLDYNIWGSAQNGIDYAAIPMDLTIPAGQQSIVIPIEAFEDQLVEGAEFIAIDVQRNPCTRDTVFIGINDNILEPPNLMGDTSICVGSPALELDGTLPIPLPDPPSFTNDQDFTIDPTNTAIISPINVFGVQPPLLDSGVIRSICLNAVHPWIDDLDIFLISPGGQFIELTTDNGANGDNYTNTCFTPVAGQVISAPGPFAPASEAPFTGDYLPEGVWSDLWDGDYPTNGTWQLQVLDDANGFVGTLTDWTITFEPAYQVSYQWSPGNGLSCTDCPITMATPTENTLYELVATDSYGCEVRDTIAIDTLSNLVAPFVDCITSTDTSITFGWNSIVNSLGYEVNINGTGWITPNGDTTHIVTGLTPNSDVTIQVRGINGALSCSPLIGTANCQNCVAPMLNTVSSPASCVGSADGSATITTDNSNPPYTFDIGSSSNDTGIFNALDAGNYTVTVTDATGCTSQIPVTVDGPPAIDVSTLAVQNVSCNGLSDGIIQASANGGVGVLSYMWSAPGNPTTQQVTNLPAGTYTVTVTDANNCTSVETVDLTEPTALAISLDKEDIDCNGGANGTAIANGSGGTAPYSFIWNNSATTDTITDLTAGNYSVTITDGNNCQETSVITILEPMAIQTTLNPIDADCFGASSGFVGNTPSGGSSPFTYNWSNGLTDQNLLNIPAGNYTVTITDSNNCTAEFSTTVGQAPQLTLSLTATQVNCNGGTDGTATAIPGGGAGGFTYLWSTGETLPDATGLGGGVVTVTITDANGCTIVDSLDVSEPALLEASAVGIDVACFNSTNGQIDLNVQGGTTPYQYNWSNGEVTEDVNNLSPGSYTVTITDNLGCTQTVQQGIAAPPPIATNPAGSDVLCFGGTSGSISLNALGGTGTLNTIWSGPNGYNGSGDQIDNLSVGIYISTTTDDSGCVLQDTVELFEPTQIVSGLPAISDTICFEGSNGIAGAQAIGGTSPYTYLWSAGNQTTASIADLLPGNYQLTITDANGCTHIASTAVVDKGLLTAQISGTDPNCHDGTDGSISVITLNYGTTPADPASFSYIWNTAPAQSGQTANGLVSETQYSVTATDSDGCTTVQSLSLNNPEPVLAQVDDTQDVDCFGNSTGWAAVSGSNGVEPYSYFWSVNGANPVDSLVQGLSAGTYPVTVSDSKGCFATLEVTIVQPDDVILSPSSTAVDCYGESTGSAMISATGGNAPYTFNWDNGSTDSQQSNLAAGTYLVTVSDAMGCTFTTDIEVTQPAGPLQGFASSTPTDCFGGGDGTIALETTGGSQPYRYSLNGGTPNGSPLQIGLKAGMYTPVITDVNGCTLELSPVEVVQPPAVEVDLGPDITIELGEGVQLEAIVSNGQEPVRFSWDLVGQSLLSCIDCFDPYADSLMYSHTFTVFVVDSNGCEATDRIQVIIDKPRRIFVPTGFTPNSDLQNDKLVVHGQTSAKVLEFKVYDRWGELVYEANDFTPNDEAFGWDGNFRGQPMNPGVYVWTLEVEYLDGATEILYGNTTLIR